MGKEKWSVCWCMLGSCLKYGEREKPARVCSRDKMCFVVPLPTP